MNANQANYHAVSDGHGGVTLIPRKGSAMEKAMKRLYPNTRFWDAPIPLQSLPGTAQNNLDLPGYRTPATAPESRDYTRDQEEEDHPPVPLDADLLRMAQQANGDPTVIEEIYAEQEQRNRRRQPSGDQVSAASAVNAATRGVHRLSEFGEEFNRDQDPDEDPDQGEEDFDGDMVEARLVGQLPQPDEGFTYVLEREPDGSVSVIQVPDTDGSDLHTNDRAYRSHTTGRDNVLARMNQIARNRHLTRDAQTIRRTIFRHVPLKPSERLVLQSNDAYPGSVDVVLISPVPGEDLYSAQSGAKRLKRDSERVDDPAGADVSGAAPEVAGEYELQRPRFADRRFRDHAQRNLLKVMNQSNWARR